MESNAPVGFRITPRLIVGLAVIAFGVLWILDDFRMVHLEDFVIWWPAILVVIGLARLFDSTAAKFPTFFLIGLGGALLANNLGYFDFDISDLIPIVIILIGLRLAYGAFMGLEAGRKGSDKDPSATTNAFAMLAGVKRQISSREYRGGEATAIMGGVELDLREASPKDGQAVIDTFAMWGGVEITVPETWTVEGRVLPLMGAFEDKTRPPREPGPRLIVKGMAIMGGVAVKN